MLDKCCVATYNSGEINKEVNAMAEKDKRLADSIARVVDTLPEREQGYLLGYAECLASQHEPCTPTGERQEGA